MIFPALKDIMNIINDNDDLDYIIVGAGPGNYSGSRVGMSAAQGIACVHDCPVISVSSFLGINGIEEIKTICVGDARRGSYFAHSLAIHDTHPNIELLTQEELIQRCEQHQRIVSYEPIKNLPIETEIIQPHAQTLLENWMKLDTDTQNKAAEKALEPNYLRATFITKSTKKHPLI